MKIVPPHHPETESILIGKALNSINAANEIFDKLSYEDFSQEKHKAIYLCMRELYRKDHAIEVSSVIDVLKRDHPQFADVAYLIQLAQECWISDDVSHHIEIVKEASRIRAMLTIFNDGMLACSDKDNRSDGIYERIQGNLDKLMNSDTSENYETLSEVMGGQGTKDDLDFIAYVEKRQEMHLKNEEVISGLKTMFPILDETLDGLNDSHYIIIAASPGVGKTTFALNMVANLLKQDIPVGFFSLEMTSWQMAAKLVSITARVDDRRIRSGEISSHEYHEVRKAVKLLEDKQLFIEGRGSPRISQVEARTRRMIQAHGIKILFVDYLGQISGEGKFSNRQEAIQQVSQRLCALGKKLNIPIVCLAQLNRDIEKESTTKRRSPRKSDLRESGQIEADAHSILILNKPDKLDSNARPGVLECYIVKNRFGQEKRIDFNFEERTGYLAELPKLNLNIKPHWNDNETR